MDHTPLSQALALVLAEQPEFRKKLATALRDGSFGKKSAAADHDYWLWQSLSKLSDRGPEIMEMIRTDPEHLDDWHEHKINLAAEYIDAVYDALQCGADSAMQCNLEDLESGLSKLALDVNHEDHNGLNLPLLKSKTLIDLTVGALTKGQLWGDYAALEAPLVRASLIANQTLSPPGRQRARAAVRRIENLVAHLQLPPVVEANVYARVLLEALTSLATGWSEVLLLPIRTLVRNLHQMATAQERAKGLQITLRLNDLLDKSI